MSYLDLACLWVGRLAIAGLAIVAALCCSTAIRSRLGRRKLKRARSQWGWDA